MQILEERINIILDQKYGCLRDLIPHEFCENWLRSYPFYQTFEFNKVARILREAEIEYCRNALTLYSQHTYNFLNHLSNKDLFLHLQEALHKEHEKLYP